MQFIKIFNPLKKHILPVFSLIVVMVMTATNAQADFLNFVGTYTGSALVVAADGTETPRDLSVTISETKKGFRVHWKSIDQKKNKSPNEKSYTIEFVPSNRDTVFAAAMRKNLFGHEVQLNPMEGEPYVWSRIEGDTLTLYSLHVAEHGGYSLQQYDRTITKGGMNLRFKTITDGAVQRVVEAFLQRQ